MTPCVIYLRCSSDKQENSVDDQRRHVLGHAAKCGYQVVREYVDDGLSGGDLNRPAFLRMVRDAADKRDFRRIVVWSLDRFGRFDVIDAGRFVGPLRDAGVCLETLDRGMVDWSDFAGRLVWTVEQEGKKAYLVDLSRHTLRSMSERARRGDFLGGRPPYGYRAVDREGAFVGRRPARKLVPGDPAHIDVVRWLFKTFAEKDTSLRALSAELGRRGVATPAGCRSWAPSTVRTVLKNRLYVGDAVWGRLSEARYHHLRGGTVVPNGHRAKRSDGRSKRVRMTAEDMVVVADAHPALVDRETFAMVQAKLTGRKGRTTPQTGGGDWLLSGLLRCGHCGLPMYAQTNARFSGRGRNSVWRRYLCSGYTRTGPHACHFHWVREDIIFRCVVEKLQAEVVHPDNLAALRDELRRLAEQEAVEPDQELVRSLRAKLAALEGQISQGAERLLLVPPELLSTAAAKLTEWKTQRDALQAELAALEQSPEVAKASVEEQIRKAEAQLWRLHEALESIEPSEVRAVLGEMIDHVELWWECKADTGGPRKCLPLRGVIHLKNPDGSCRLVANGSPLTSYQ
jgi:DNA invertase Pin-like site-specific DNA recombinase